ncbi:hypothetical protein KOI35_33005 [Actinoplanes bogorensis]|uniref:Uncharacterized protein n=1 Tax=Paractinoplanes bogorensis TaxID=1610840 RepID=A0ABS5Z037_9ACTN|nr:hypothetical protein [Actinoplanes bogorensis]MBU2668343.1 hypothetical protein [Actinoplanes bogorensis]
MESWSVPRGIVAAIDVPLLLINAYLLLYWLPAIQGPGDEPCDPVVDGWGACWRPDQRVWWIVAAALTLAGLVCTLMSLRRYRRAVIWSWWFLGSMTFLLAGLWAGGNIS